MLKKNVVLQFGLFFLTIFFSGIFPNTGWSQFREDDIKNLPEKEKNYIDAQVNLYRETIAYGSLLYKMPKEKELFDIKRKSKQRPAGRKIDNQTLNTISLHLNKVLGAQIKVDESLEKIENLNNVKLGMLNKFATIQFKQKYGYELDVEALNEVTEELGEKFQEANLAYMMQSFSGSNNASPFSGFGCQ